MYLPQKLNGFFPQKLYKFWVKYFFVGSDVSASTVDEYDSLGSNDYGDYNAQDPTSNYDNLYDDSYSSSNLDYSSNDDPCMVSITK